MRRSYLLGLLLACFTVQGQVIDTFPYVQDFENFTTIQTSGSCVTPAGLSIGGWTQPTTDDGDWRADTAGTATIGTGPGATYASSGVGTGTDASPGTTGGIYLYIEASSCDRKEYSIESPVFDLSNADTMYLLRFAYHMYGEDVHSLHVDIYSDGQWNMDHWVRYRQQDSAWLYAEIPLVEFREDSVQIRFTAISGMGEASDIAIDDVRILPYSQTSYDAGLAKLSLSHPYTSYPLVWEEDLELDVQVYNQGTNDLSGAWVEVGNPSVADTVDFDSLYYSTEETSSAGLLFTSTGEKTIEAVIHVDQTDGNSVNDTLRTTAFISDSTLGDDNGIADFNLGYNGGTGFQGKVLHVAEGDTVTSISFHCIGTAGDSTRAFIYTYSGAPGTQLASTETIALDGTEGWKTLQLNCPTYLSAGDYFLSVEQMATNRISLGANFHNYKPQKCYYSGTGLAWTSVESIDFFGNYMIRLNYGEIEYPDVSIIATTDTICEGQRLSIRATGADNYLWGPSSSVASTVGEFNFTDMDQSGFIYVTGTTSCGFTDSDTIYMQVNKGPTATVTPDTTACLGDVIALQCFTSSTNTYKWAGGPTDANYNRPVTGDTFYQVRVDTTNGCFDILQVRVSTSSTEITVVADTTVCQREMVMFSASGANSYTWPDGSSDSTYSFQADQSGYVVATGVNDAGCEGSDSAYLTVLQTPVFVVSADTGACFGDSLYLMASGADSIQWVDGPAGGVYPLKVRRPETYIVHAFNANGCNDADTVAVEMWIPPFLEMSNDTTVCEGQNVQLDASGGDLFEWSNGATTSSITITASETGYWGVKTSSLEGCSDEDSILVTVDPLPEAGFQVEVQNDSVARFQSDAMHADSYSWDFGDGATSTDENPEHIYDSSATYTITYTVTNECGTDQVSDTLTITLPVTGSISAAFQRGVSIYPVPTNGDLRIRIKTPEQGRLQIQLTDAKGAVLISQDEWKAGYSGSYDLDLSEWPAGLYFLHLNLGEEFGTWKVIKR